MPRLLLIALLLAGLLWAPAAQAGWEPGVIAAANGDASARPPHLLMDDAGRAVIVYASGGQVRAIVRAPDGSFGASTPLGAVTSPNEKLGVEIAPGTGRVVVGWANGLTIRTAVLDPGGAWLVPNPGDPGTYTAAGTPSYVSVGMNADGRAVVVWDEGQPSGTIRMARLEAAGWQPAETFGGADSFFRGKVGRDDDGAVVIAYQRQVANEQRIYIARRAPDGSVTGPTPLSDTVSRFEGFALEPTARKVVLGWYHDAPGGETDTYNVWEGDTRTLSGTTRVIAPAVRPGVQSGSRAAVTAVEPGTGDGFATWMAGSPPSFANVGAATGFGPAWDRLDLLKDVTRATSIAGARSGFGEEFSVFTEIDPNFPAPEGYRVSSFRRSACAGGTWTTTRDVLSRGRNLGAVSAGASATGEALASAVTVGGDVLVFRYTPGTSKPTCAAPAESPVNNVAPGLEGSSQLIVCGGSGTIVPSCFGQIPQPDPIVTCGPAFGTILRSCDGLGLGIGGAPLGLGGDVPVDVGCGDVGSLRSFGKAIAQVAKTCSVNLQLTMPGFGDALLKGVRSADKGGLLKSMEDLFDTFDAQQDQLTKLTAATQNATRGLTTPDVLPAFDKALDALTASTKRVQGAEQALATNALADPDRRLASGATAARSSRGAFGSIGGAIHNVTSTILANGVRLPDISGPLTQLTGLNQQLISRSRIFEALNRKAAQNAGSDTRVRAATAAAAGGAAARRRLGKRLPIAAKVVVVPNGTRTRVKLKLAPWARPLLRRAAGRRLTVVASSRSVRGGGTRTSTRTVRLRVARR